MTTMQLVPSGKQKTSPVPPNGEVPSKFIKAEVNLLRLPLFALSTKGLKTLDGIECQGTTSRNGETQKFTLRLARSTDTMYPGPLSRAAHLALLSIVTERGLPAVNPITWSWGDLCRRMGVTDSGRMFKHTKAAIAATASLTIRTEHALFSKSDQKRLNSTGTIFHLYDRVIFVSERLPSGEVADTNYLWLADWYLANLNALYTAPLDYELWRRLDAQSTISSRLYEFLLFNFHRNQPVFRINYPTLVSFLPLTPERYFSQAKQQLDPALKLLALRDVIETATWTRTREGVPQLAFHRGDRLSALSNRRLAMPASMAEPFSGALEVRELRNLKPPEHGLVSEFYRLWNGSANANPSAKELSHARDLIATHGIADAKALMPRVVERLRTKWPDAKTFGAAVRYFDEAVDAHRAEESRSKQRQETSARSMIPSSPHDQFIAVWKPRWDALSQEHRASIEQRLVAQNPFLTKGSRVFEILCLQALASREANG